MRYAYLCLVHINPTEESEPYSGPKRCDMPGCDNVAKRRVITT